MIAAAGLGQYCMLHSGAGRSSPIRNLVQLAVFGSVSHAFQKISLGIFLSFFIIGGTDCSCLRLRGVFAVAFRRICANRGWVASLADTVMEYQIISSLSRTNALYNMAPPSLFGEMDLHRAKLALFRGQR